MNAWDKAVKAADRRKSEFDDKIRQFRAEQENLFKSFFPKELITTPKEIKFKTRDLPLFGK